MKSPSEYELLKLGDSTIKGGGRKVTFRIHHTEELSELVSAPTGSIFKGTLRVDGWMDEKDFDPKR